MLTEWLAPDPLDWFMQNHFQTAPFARPATPSRCGTGQRSIASSAAASPSTS